MTISRQYAIFSVTELEKINFNEVLETGPDTVIFSVDGAKTFVKWETDEVPLSIKTLTTLQGYYNHAEILNILSGFEWNRGIQE